jgi:hypothetical protein
LQDRIQIGLVRGGAGLHGFSSQLKSLSNCYK